jgi:hypothetical protein
MLLTVTYVAQQYKSELTSTATLNMPPILLQKLFKHNGSNDMCVKERKTLNVPKVTLYVLAYLVISAHQNNKRVPQQGDPPDQADFELVIFQAGTEETIALVVKRLSLFHCQYGHLVLPIDMKLQVLPVSFYCRMLL